LSSFKHITAKYAP